MRPYVGLPWRDLGRGRDGADCWGLVGLVYRDRLGVRLEDLAGVYGSASDPHGVTRAVAAQLGPGGPGWLQVPLEAGRPLDVVLLRMYGFPWHAGVLVAPGRVLHMPYQGTSCVERLDSVTFARRVAGVYRHRDTELRLTGRRRPFGELVDVVLPAGGSIVDVLRAAGIEPVPMLRVCVGTVEVPYERWQHVRPRPGRSVTVAAVPEGGNGKGALRLIASIALIAAASFAFGPLAGAVGKAGASLIIGAATIGASLALNALAPPPRTKLNQADRPSPSITGARNEIRLYQPWVDVLGFYRLVPPFAAAPYTENVGDDQFIRMLFDCGYGPKEITDIQIGETPLEEFEGVELEVRSGFPGEEPIRLFPSIVHEESLQVELLEASGWVVRTSAEDADEISVDVTFPSGLARIGDDGGREPYTVAIEVEYSVAGANDWRRVNGDGEEGGGADGAPVDARQMDLLFREPEVRRVYGPGLFADRVAWGLGFPDGKPNQTPDRYFSWTATGWFRDPNAPENGGLYRFSVDGSDAIDLEVDGQIVASWYDVHNPVGGTGAPPSYPEHAGPEIRLSRGWHRIRVRMEARSTTGAVAVGWLTPAAGVWATMPASVFKLQPDRDATTGLLATAYDTAAYGSSIGTTAEQTGPLRQTRAWAVPRGQYDVRVRRTTPDSDDPRILDDVFWTALRTITNENPLPKGGRALIALRIRATDQLQGVIDNLSAMVRSIVPDWDAEEGAWIERTSNNPAALYRYILQGPVNGRPLPDARVDLEELQAWHEACAAEGWAFNGALDFAGTVFERLSDVAAAGRGSFGMREGLYSVVRDRRQTVPVQVITPRNSYGFRGRKVFPEQVHCLRVGFMNEEIGYQRDERLVLNDGYQIGGRDAFGNPAPDLPEATKFESIDLFGVTSPALAWRHGRFHLAVAKLRPETIEVGMDVEHLACVRGDLVLMSHYAWGETQSVAGRVRELIEDTGGDLAGIVVDEEVTMDAGVGYGVRVRLADGTFFQASLQVGAGEVTRRLLFSGPVPDTVPWPAVGDLAVFGLVGLETREMIVQRIEPEADLSARLTLVDHAPAVHDSDTGVIPPFDSGVTGPPTYQDAPETPIIERILSDDWAMVRQADGSFSPRMVIVLRRPSSQRPLPVEAEVGIRQRVEVGPPTPYWYRRFPLVNSSVTLDQVEVGVEYEIRLRVISRLGRASAWVTATHTVLGNVLAPPDVESFAVEQLADGTRRYSWDLGVIPPDIAGVIIRYTRQTTSPVWESMTQLHTDVMDAASPQELLLPDAGAWTFGIVMVDTAGNQSRNPLYIDAALTTGARSDLIRREDARLMNWPGTLVDCVRIAGRFGPFLEGAGTISWNQLAAAGAGSWNNWRRWNLAPRSPIEYIHTMDIGAIVSTNVFVEAGWSGRETLEVYWSENGTAFEGPISTVEAALRAVRARYIRVRLVVAAVPESGAYVPRIAALAIEARGVAVEHFVDNLNPATLGSGYRLGVGDFRVPLSQGQFAIIGHVNLTFNGSGAGFTYELVDRVPYPGPRIRIYGPDDAPADAIVDVSVRGFAGDIEDPGASTAAAIFANADLSALLGAV